MLPTSRWTVKNPTAGKCPSGFSEGVALLLMRSGDMKVAIIEMNADVAARHIDEPIALFSNVQPFGRADAISYGGDELLSAEGGRDDADQGFRS